MTRRRVPPAPKPVSLDEYNGAFSGRSGSPNIAEPLGTGPQSTRRAAALQHALDIRKFEIQLYWTRSAYFWTFIGAALVAYGGTRTLTEPERTDLTVLLCNVGLVFSVAWFFANRGSKQWQENWENHVDRLEDDVTGPIYKTVLRRPKPQRLREHIERFVPGPGPYSVSKINQLISVYICIFWVLLLLHALPPFSRDAAIAWRYVIATGFSLSTIAGIARIGRTNVGHHVHVRTVRTTEIIDEASDGAS